MIAKYEMEVSSGRDLPSANAGHKPGKEVPSFNCGFYDVELVRKIAQAFIPGIATACVDTTSGDIFKSPASVAAALRQEMAEFVSRRSESFVAETVVEENGPGNAVFDHPYDVISNFIEQFAESKANLFSRVSGYMLSEKREDKIEDFAQELEMNGFWMIDKREALAQVLIKNVDYTNKYHCNAGFESEEELTEHRLKCGFRTVSCDSEGCNVFFSEKNAEMHDLNCPFKMIICEQMCNSEIMRRDMDRHCVTVCSMRLVSCPFYSAGCVSSVPHCKLEQHLANGLPLHMLAVLRSVYKESSQEDLEQRVERLQKASKPGQFEKAQNIRSLASAVKDLEAKLGPTEIINPKENVKVKLENQI